MLLILVSTVFEACPDLEEFEICSAMGLYYTLYHPYYPYLQVFPISYQHLVVLVLYYHPLPLSPLPSHCSGHAAGISNKAIKLRPIAVIKG